MSSTSLTSTLTAAQLLAQRSAADHLAAAASAAAAAATANDDDEPSNDDANDCHGLTAARALALLAAQSAARDTSATDDTDDTDDEASAVSDLSSKTPASHASSSRTHATSASLRSSLSGPHLSGPHLSSSNLSGTKRPSGDSLSVTGYMSTLLRTADSADGLGLGLSRNATTPNAATDTNTTSANAAYANTSANDVAYANIPILSSSTGLSLSRSNLSGSSSHRSIKRSRNSLRSFNSSLNTVGEHDGEPRANSEWTSVPLNDTTGGAAGAAATGSNGNGMQRASSAMGLQLRRQPSSRSVLAGGSVPSRAGLRNQQGHHTSFANHQPHPLPHPHSSAAGLDHSSAGLNRSNASRSANLASSSAAGATAPRPNANPFLGGGQTSAAANFLALLNGGCGGGAGVGGGGDLATRMPPPLPSGAPARQGTWGMPPPAGREPSSLSAAGMPGPLSGGSGTSSAAAAREFLRLLQRPAGIGPVQALVRSEQPTRQVQQRQSQRKAGEPEEQEQQQQQQGVRRVQSFVGGCQGSTPPQASISASTAPLQVTDNSAVLHKGQTAAAAHAAQIASASNDRTNANTEASELSPQQLLMTTIRERRTPGGTTAAPPPPPTIRPVLSIEHRFHEHTPAEIAAYPPTAMLVRNNDLAGLRMAHKGSSNTYTTLQTSNRFGESLLHIACRRGYDDIARYLLDEAGVTPWVRDDFGRTPCHDACWTATPNLALMDLLVQRCPEMLLMSDKRGSTPLDYVRKDNWDVWRQFLSERWDVICPRVGSSTCSTDKS